MDKQTVVHAHHGISLSQEKEHTTDRYNNLDECPGNRAEWKRPTIKDNLLCDSITQHS